MISNSSYSGGFDELVVNDQGCIRRWGIGYFDTVLDIGANMGVFSILMRMLHPEAKVVAMEPSSRNIKVLKSNVDYMNIAVDTRALGDGSIMYFQHGLRHKPPEDWFSHDKNKHSYPVQSVPFWQFFLDHKCSINEKFCLKIDCEGAEKFLIGDSKSEEILIHADHIFIEIHGKGKSNTSYKNENLLNLSDFRKWVGGTFSKTHLVWEKITKRREGLGYYIISRP